MKFSMLNKAVSMLGSVVVIATLSSTAHAGCINSVWQKVSGNAVFETIRGRDCNGNLSVRFQTGVGDTGWVEMRRGNVNFLHATLVDNIFTTKVTMKPVGTVMWAFFKEEETSGSINNSQAQYTLENLQ